MLAGLSALLIGMAFGFVAQRGGFCLSRGLSRLFIERDASIVRAWGLALVVGAVGVRLLMSGGLLDVPVRPFRWVAALVGGLVFGAGIILSGSCSAGAWTRLRERGWAAVAVIGGLAAGVTVASFGTLARYARRCKRQRSSSRTLRRRLTRSSASRPGPSSVCSLSPSSGDSGRPGPSVPPAGRGPSPGRWWA